MLNPKTQRYLGWLVFIGTFVSCFGCFLGFRNDLGSMRVFLILGEIILVPIFIYFIYIRSVSSRRYKARQKRREAQAQKELESLGSLDPDKPDTHPDPRSPAPDL